MDVPKRGKRIALLAGCVAVAILCAFTAHYWEEIRLQYLLSGDFESIGKNAQGYREYKHRQTGIVLVKLPGATFLMGSPETEKGQEDDESPVHEVTLSPFLIAKHEVSQAEWVKVMGENPSNFKGESLPVENVSWKDCQIFCEKTNMNLPSEAQWEYACRAGTITPFAFGETITTDQANYNGEYPFTGIQKGENREQTVTVDSFNPNNFGLYQMHGNVFEWCEDAYDWKFYSKAEATTRNPVCTTDPLHRVVRGGGWFNSIFDCRSANRRTNRPSNRWNDLGFRPSFPPP